MNLKTLGTTNTWLVVFIIVLLLSCMLMIATFTLVAKNKQQDDEYLKYVQKLSDYSQEITQQAALAVKGNLLSFQSITTAQTQYKDTLDKLTTGVPNLGIPKSTHQL